MTYDLAIIGSGGAGIAAAIRATALEHIRAESAAGARLQRVLDATVWPHLFRCCHTGRDTVTAVGDAGFDMQRMARLRFPGGPIPTPTSTHILGVAVRRPDPMAPFRPGVSLALSRRAT